MCKKLLEKANESNVRLVLSELENILKVPSYMLADRIQYIIKECTNLQAEIIKLQNKAVTATEVYVLNDINFIARILTDVSNEDLTILIDEFKKLIISGVILLIADIDDKVSIAVGVTNDLTSKISAITIAKAASKCLGGNNGGGRKDMAWAGGTNIAEAANTIKTIETLIYKSN